VKFPKLINEQVAALQKELEALRMRVVELEKKRKGKKP
jgi:cell division protein FtsB